MSLYEEKSTPDVDPAGKAPEAPGPTEVDQLLAGIKNERGEQKYATVQEAIKGLMHSQEFINTIKQENSELRTQVKSQEQLEQLLKLKEPPVEKAEPQVPASQMTPEQIEAIIEQREQRKKFTDNNNKVKAALQSAFGAEYGEKLKAKTAELGLTPELVDNMANTAPDALLKLFGVDKPAVQKPSFTGENTQQFNGEKPKPKRFNPFEAEPNSDLAKWKEIAKRVEDQYTGS